MKNEIHAALCDLGLSTPDSLIPLYPRVRDRDDISVLRCKQSGAILLSRSDHIDSRHYEEQEGFAYWKSRSRKGAVLSCIEDNKRREADLFPLVANKKWLDVGTGSGAVLDSLGPYASKVMAVELQNAAREVLARDGYEVYPSMDEVPDNDIEVVTLFHVFEHFTKPIADLAAIRKKMAPGGTLLIEIPHARDFLLSTLDLDAFKAFTFWSEHLILHTRSTLEAFIKAAGFSTVNIQGYQRYPLANHLYWLRHQQPKGHLAWSFLRSEKLDEAYAEALIKVDQSDSLLAFATV